jgi:hypothetical protein
MESLRLRATFAVDKRSNLVFPKAILFQESPNPPGSLAIYLAIIRRNLDYSSAIISGVKSLLSLRLENAQSSSHGPPCA